MTLLGEDKGTKGSGEGAAKLVRFLTPPSLGPYPLFKFDILKKQKNCDTSQSYQPPAPLSASIIIEWPLKLIVLSFCFYREKFAVAIVAR